MLKIFIFLLFPTFLIAHQFKSFQISPIVSYRQEEVDWSIRGEGIADPNATRENFDTFHVFEVGGNMELLIPCRIFFRGRSLWGFGHTSHAINEARRNVFNQNDQFIAQVHFINHYDAKSYILDTSALLGIPIKWRPLTLIFFSGYGYDRENIQRKNSPFSQTIINSATFTYRPTDHLGFKFYAPLVGVELQFTPRAKGCLKFIGEYEFHWGRLKNSASYVTTTELTGFFQEAKQNVSVKKRALSHRFFLQILFNLARHFNLGLKLKYLYLRAKSGHTNEQIKIIEIENGVTSTSQQTLQSPFNGFVWQYLGAEISFALQF